MGNDYARRYWTIIVIALLLWLVYVGLSNLL